MSYRCRACNSTELKEVLDMGAIPLAGDFHAGAKAKKYPLVIDRCLTCGILQVRDLVPHKVLFNEKYCYASSTIPALVEHFKGLALHIKDLLSTRGTDSHVLEIGCNDGVLLSALNDLGIENIGVDASSNIVEQAIQKGCMAKSLVFCKETAIKLIKYATNGYDVVTCSNVFAHNEDPNNILVGINRILKPNGYVVIEVHDVAALHKTLQWDCFYHEHCFYWSADTLARILIKHGFQVVDLKRMPMHGGALRVTAQRVGTTTTAALPNEPALDWETFGKQARRSAGMLNDIVRKLGRNHYLYLLGAAGRATTLINYADIGACLQCAYDGSPLRIGHTIPGTNVSIRDEKALSELKHSDSVDYCFIFGAWHLEQDLIKKFKTYSTLPANSVKFLTPLPRVQIF